MAVIVARGMEGHCVKVAVTLPGRGVPATTDHQYPASKNREGLLSVPGALGAGIPMGHTTQVWSPSNLCPSGFSPDSASLAFSILKPLFIVVLIHKQAPSSALG